jgi:hypothetical protein
LEHDGQTALSVIERTAAVVDYRYVLCVGNFKHLEDVMNFASASAFLIMGAAIAMVGAVSAPNEASAAPICPQFVTNYCVFNSHHLIFTAETNPCFAKERHWTVIYQGQCKFRH